MCDIGVGEQPDLDLGSVYILQQSPQLRIGLDDVLQGQSIVDLGIVRQGINLVVTHEALYGKPIVCVVLLVKPDGLIPGELEMLGEVLVDEIHHQILNLGALG